MKLVSVLVSALAATPGSLAFQPATPRQFPRQTELYSASSDVSRRDWVVGVAVASAGVLLGGSNPQSAEAIGPVKIDLLNPTYSAVTCPKDKPIPGEKAMKGMKGLCVTVDVDLGSSPEKDLDKVGVYGYVTDKGTGESVLANNPDLSTDAGQFAIVPEIKSTDKKIQFEFIAAVPREMDVSQFDAGIAPLDFNSLRVISFPGGQQYGAISPCEMNEFSDECEAWEAENGPYERGDFMVKSNPRTKGR